MEIRLFLRRLRQLKVHVEDESRAEHLARACKELFEASEYKLPRSQACTFTVATWDQVSWIKKWSKILWRLLYYSSLLAMSCRLHIVHTCTRS